MLIRDKDSLKNNEMKYNLLWCYLVSKVLNKLGTSFLEFHKVIFALWEQR